MFDYKHTFPGDDSPEDSETPIYNDLVMDWRW